ncbi:MAG: N-6 DNA methylase [Bacteroidales bacterium]|nr:N-6 DNA methylase [Bacteroidales bacterium]
MIDKDSAFKKIADLVTRFEEQYEFYKRSDYNETLTRRDFIDPFFKALGWDIDNENGYAESYREVIHEDKIKVGGATKAPDYSFRLVGGKRLFFVEAKKPSVQVKDDIYPAYQVRRYGWSAKLPISIITDFEEFSIYDCTKKPTPTDKASVARIKYLTYQDYLKEFDFLWNTFSKERVLKGSFDKFVQSDTHKKGTTTVDKEFLQSLDRWRTYLATRISWNNKDLDEDEINFVVQQTIDRIIFLRIAEDRSVEPYGNLKNALKQGDFYQNLFGIFREADEKYNSGLFDFKKDKISKDLKIDNKVIKTIINELYYPESPYEFSVLSVEILGSAYEQFLGKVIRITPAHHAKIEEKPEVRKAGGVYYTPQYIVDYIVKNTVGKLVENNTPKEVSNIKIVDPACGSGSFLIGAFQYLLDWHKNYYTDNGKVSKGNKGNPMTPDGNLTTAEKKRILLNNIHGVDIDVNAVEVTKLSLLLKCMEGETDASIATQFKLFNERVLPTLDNNIKSGNSLIDIDFYASQLDFGDEKKIKPFNWQKGFPEVFKQGGFDVVIGNPPYVRIQTLKETAKESVEYFKIKYKTAIYGNYDLYVLFVEKGLIILKENGTLGFILPNKFFNTDYGIGLRKLIIEKKYLKSIVDFKHNQVFENATTYCCLLFLQNKINLNFSYLKVIPKVSTFHISDENSIKIDLLDSSPWNFYNSEDKSILEKLKCNTVELINIPCEISRGSSTGNDNIYVLKHSIDGKLINGYNELVTIEDEILKIPIYATDYSRFNFKSPNVLRIILA